MKKETEISRKSGIQNAMVSKETDLYASINCIK
jgi:hypothetical protein